MQATIEGRDPVFDEPKPMQGAPDGEAEPEQEGGFPGPWCDDILRRIGRLSNEFESDFSAASFVQLTRLVDGWNGCLSDLQPRLGTISTLLQSILAEQVKTREAIEAQTKIIEQSNATAERVVNGLGEVYKVLKGMNR